MTECQCDTERTNRRRRDYRAHRHNPEQHARLLTSADLLELLNLTVAGGFDINERELRQPNRGVARTALARQSAMYLAHVACGLTKTEVGRLFTRDRTTVHHACRVVEQRRDDQAFDHAIDHLERIVRIVVGTRRTPCTAQQ